MSINWKHFHLSEERKSQEDHLVLVSVLLQFLVLVSVLVLVLVLVSVSGILQVDKVSSLPAKSSLVFMTSYTSRLDDLSRNKESVSRRSFDPLTQSG